MRTEKEMYAKTGGRIMKRAGVMYGIILRT